jgi:hypothetical protein
MRFRGIVVVVAAAATLWACTSSAWAGGPGKWTKLGTVDQAFNTLSLLRTGDGNLHVVWLAKAASNSTHSYKISTISQSGKLLGTNTPLPSPWASLDPDPQLVRDGSGMRLIFIGSTGTTGCYSNGFIYTSTSPDGSHWTLGTGAMSHGSVGISNLAATTESDGVTPVALFAGGRLFHVGVDPSCPAAAPDSPNPPTPSTDTQSNPQIATDQGTGAVWAGWFQAFSKLGYWVDQLRPTKGSPIEAPHSAASAAHTNQPLEPVALTARPGGGVYMAYCTASSSQGCAHIDLWKVGTSTAKVVPGSHNVSGARVALAAGPAGRLSVIWYDETKNVIHAVRTNTSATSFGVVRTIKVPGKTSGVNVIRADGSSGRLDVLLLDQLSTSGAPFDVFSTQILPGLSLAAKPHKFSHKNATKVTFAVKDAGQAVQGAKVSCLGKSGTTDATGQAKLSFHKGEPTGKHVCTATKKGYNSAKTTIKVT